MTFLNEHLINLINKRKGRGGKAEEERKREEQGGAKNKSWRSTFTFLPHTHSDTQTDR